MRLISLFNVLAFYNVLSDRLNCLWSLSQKGFLPSLVPCSCSGLLILSHLGLPPGSCPELFVLSAVSVLPVDNYTSTCTDFCLLPIAAGLINCLLALESSVVLL